LEDKRTKGKRKEKRGQEDKRTRGKRKMGHGERGKWDTGWVLFLIPKKPILKERANYIFGKK
jgi:hypothetical protein